MLRRLLAALRGAAPSAVPTGAGAPQLNDAGVAALRRGDLQAAERAFRDAIALDPRFAPAHCNLGMVLWTERRLAEGAASLRTAVALDPAHTGQRINLANALVVGNCLPEAIAEYREVLRVDPGHVRAIAGLTKPLLDVCDWDGAETLVAGLVARWEAGDAATLDALTPFTSLLVEMPQRMRREIAARHAELIARRVAPLARPALSPARRPGRLRIGYASADFHDHATAHLATGLFEHHERSRFEVHAYSYGTDDGSACRRRLVAAFEHFHDVRALPHDALAARIVEHGIDVLVDLKGYTTESRPEILALRPAPVQVSYLGYPGTMGATFIDYLIGDAVVIPRGKDDGYTERVVRLPGSYQVNDDRQAIAADCPAREACGLPTQGVVFACFNKHHKIERAVFAAWLRILAAVPGSVLWLLGGHGRERLVDAARAQGVDPARLVFAGKLPKAEHLARHRHADLFLDTRQYNAHTTASDALWAGLPVLTTPGPDFAGRVAASLLEAVGLPELVVADLAAYERTAIDLARDPERLAALRHRLAASRTQAPLFDTGAFTRALEQAFETMHERYAQGKAPAAIDVTRGDP